MRSHPTCHVGAPRDRVGPLLLNCSDEALIGVVNPDVDCARRQIQRTDGMATQHRRLANRFVVLKVFGAEGDGVQQSVAAAINEQSRQFEVAAISCGSGELGEGNLDLGVSADGHSALGAEFFVEMICQLPRDCRQLVIVARAESGNRRLQQMAETVQLMPELQV